MASFATHLVVVVTMLFVAMASAEMLQDVCVADLSNGIYLTNTFCFNQFYLTRDMFSPLFFCSSLVKTFYCFFL